MATEASFVFTTTRFLGLLKEESIGCIFSLNDNVQDFLTYPPPFGEENIAILERVKKIVPNNLIFLSGVKKYI